MMVLAKENLPEHGVPPATWPGWTFVRYLIGGLASAAVDFSTFGAMVYLFGIDPLWQGWQAVVANCVSRPLGGVTCFFVHRHFTFAAAGGRPVQIQFATFWCVFFLNLLLTTLLISLFCKGVGLPEMVGKGLAEAIALVFTFLTLKHWTFR